MTEDLPTFDFPAKATAGILLLINCAGAAADLTNSALLTFSAFISSLLHHGAQLLSRYGEGRRCRFFVRLPDQNKIENIVYILRRHKAEL